MECSLVDRIQRVRDPIHNLIVFHETSSVDQLAWRLLNTRAFQRLRRIKQLGFSELVYPGATHTRFAHCIGVFENARRLIDIVERKLGSVDRFKSDVAVIAALLHDLGHGPFSHTFEGVEKARGVRKKHEIWTKEIVEEDAEVRSLLDGYDPKLALEVGKMLTRKDPQDIFDSIVSSQFDADRLDYLPRDRYMAGIGGGEFDVRWMLDCLEVGDITVGLEGEGADFVTVKSLFLSDKGLHAAESYVLARYYLYSQVYMHKTTRSAEKMLASLLRRASELIALGDVPKIGLAETHPLVRYFRSAKPTVDEYLALDDVTIWAALSEMQAAPDANIAVLANRLLNRRLFKCIDVGALAKAHGGDSVMRFRKTLKDSGSLESGVEILEDTAKLTPYGIYDYDDKGALQKVLVARRGHKGKPDDLASISALVRAIETENIYRTYAADASAQKKIEDMWKETIQ